MERRAAQAPKSLSELDKVYDRLTNYDNTAEKLKYCTSLLERTQNYIQKYGNHTDHIRFFSEEMIEATKREIEKLLKENNTK
jgi:hypothetical protein